MDNTRPQPECTQIELLTVKCRPYSALQLFSGADRQPGYTSFLVSYFCSLRESEPDWVYLPGLYLLDDNLEYLRRVSIRYDQESVVILRQTLLPVESDLCLHRFALLTLGPDGEFLKCGLWLVPNDPTPIILHRELAHVLAKCADSL